MNHLLHELAPVSEAAWHQIEHEASRTLRHFLAARRVVDFIEPRGWDHSAESTGRIQALDVRPAEGVDASVRQVLALVELRTPFEVSRAELDAVDRGLANPELATVTEAARRAAYAEDQTVFHGYPAAGIAGVAGDSPHEPLLIEDDYHRYPRVVARAVAQLQHAAVEGPYAIALGPECYTGVIETTEHGGYPVFEHIRLILGGPIVRASSVNGAFVVSQRGGDFEIVCGQDFSIGYSSHTDAAVRLYLEESVAFRSLSPEAGIALIYPPERVDAPTG